MGAAKGSGKPGPFVFLGPFIYRALDTRACRAYCSSIAARKGHEMNPESKYLSERLISRLSPLRRSNLYRRAVDRVEGLVNHGLVRQPRATVRRAERMLGRLAALTA